jgi:prefoldin subunit 2
MSQFQVTEQQIIARFKQMRQEIQAISSKVGELQIELNDHKYHHQKIKKSQHSHQKS